MILRRITEHVKAQNWFAVGIDFFIVVFGVFIGIQVSNWNAVRGERQDEVSALNALRQDIAATATNLQTELDGSIAGSVSLRILAEYADGQHDDLALAQIDQHILSGVFVIPGTSPTMGTYDELRNTGRLGLIGDDGLRRRLAQLASEIESLETDEAGIEKMSYETTDPFLLKEYDWRGFVSIPSRTGGIAVEWLDPMKDRRDVRASLRQREFLNIVLYRARLNIVYQRSANELSESLTDIEGLIEQRLEETGHAQ